VKLAFNGAGVLDNFDAKLDFAAGPDVWARGDVVVARQGAGRRLIVDLNSRIEGMTPPIIRPVFAGETTLKGDLFFDDDSTIATPGLHVVSANTRLDIEGGRSADDTVGLKIHAGAIPGATQIGKLDLNVSIVGSALSPITEGSFDAGDIHVEQGSLDHIAASFRAVPNGPLNLETTRIAFEGQGAMSGLALADPGLARAIGSEAKLSLRGTAAVGGEVSFDALDLTSRDLDARYSGLLAPKKVHGRLEVTARFEPLCASRRRYPQGRSARDRRSRRRAQLRRADRDPRRAGDPARHRLSNARPRHCWRTSPDRSPALDAWRRLRLRRPTCERSAWLGQAERRFRPRQGGPQCADRRAASECPRSPRLWPGSGRRHADGAARRSKAPP
jgi:hypothetical protein